MHSKLNLTSDEKTRHHECTYGTMEGCEDLHFLRCDGVINLQVGSVSSFYHEAEEASCHRHKILEAVRTNQLDQASGTL